MFHGHHEFKETYHEHHRTGRSKKLSDLDGSMGRRADSVAACAGRELIRRPRALNKNFLVAATANSALKNCIYIPRRKPVVFALNAVPAHKELPMLAKCANPSCSTPLVYLREGKIFMVESAQSQTDKDGAILIRPRSSKRVEHFWLCGPCAAQMTLTYDHQRGIEVVKKGVSKAPDSFRAAAS
jgi:hypothetical protein